jgi:NAD-dependent deacetylase
MPECGQFESKSEIIAKSKKITFLTGSGISEASNIPTFRGTGGYWKKYKPTELATTTSFNKNPKLVWEWYYERRRKIINSNPNRAHQILAEIEKLKDAWIITQNIDGLHQAAGSTKIRELHGNIFRIKCINCDFKGKLDGEFPPIPPKCQKCGNLLRPDVVWFDEDPDEKTWNDAVKLTLNSDIFIIVGTSLPVEPANKLPKLAKEKEIFLIEINPGETGDSKIMDMCIRTKAIEGLTCLLNVIRNNTA